MDLHENSHLHRCCICVIIASGLLAVGNDDFREVCHCVSGRLLLWSIPFLRLQWHIDRCILYTATHEHIHASINSHTYIYTLTHKHTHTHMHKSISQTGKSKVQRWINRGTEDPRTTAITLSHDSIQGVCPVTSKHALCHQTPKNMFVMLPSECYVFPNSQVQV